MAINKNIREKVYKKFKGCCAYCGDKILYRKMQVDHIVPQSNYEHSTYNEVVKDLWVPNFLRHLDVNDVNHIDNLHPSCAKCNKFKDSFSLEKFREELGKQLERARKTSSNYRRALKYGQVKETPQPIIFHFEKMLEQPTDYEAENSLPEEDLFRFLVWYQRAPLDGLNQQEIIDLYLNEVCTSKTK